MRVGKRILLQILLLVAIVSALLSVVSFLQNRSAMLTNTQDMLTARAGENARAIAASIGSRQRILKNIAALPAVQNLDWAQQRPVLLQQAGDWGFENLFFSRWTAAAVIRTRTKSRTSRGSRFRSSQGKAGIRHGALHP